MPANKDLFSLKSVFRFIRFIEMRSLTLLGLVSAGVAFGQDVPALDLPEVTVLSPRVALQEPVGTFAMPISALRFEPLVDVQARNLAEGQADVSIRGGTFENTGFRVGAVSLYDPQTGHYFAEIPISPSMLGAPEVLTGAANAWRGWNADTGTVAYGWRPIRTGGKASVSAGQYDTQRGEFYDGYASDSKVWGRRLSADVSASYSTSNGSRPWGEQDFLRYNARVQLSNETSQTDLFYGYQSKQFGWPNLYTPFPNVFETEDIHTSLLVINHRVDFAGGDYFSAGAYYRNNRDHYVFDRPEVGAYNPAFATGPAFHKTWVYGAGIEGSATWADIRWNYAGTLIDDELQSSTLVFGRYRTRDQLKLSFVPEKYWRFSDGQIFSVKAGATYENSNRTGSAVSPLIELSLDRVAPKVVVSRIYLSYARTTQTPTYFALNSNPTRGLFRGNPDLDRQISRNLELGATAGVGPWTASTAVFFRRDNNLVDWTYSASSTSARSANPIDIDTTGFELVTRYGNKNVDVVFGYTALHKEPDYRMAVVDASFYALNYPEQRVTLAVTSRLGKGWELRMDNEFRIQEENTLRKSARRPLISSVGVYFAPRKIQKLRFSVEVENLWDSDYEEVPAVPAARRQLAFGAIYAW